MATLAVLAHHDSQGEVARHVRYALGQLRTVADELVFVTTSGSLDARSRAAIDGVDTLIQRPNTGYDFYSWHTGLSSVADWQEYDRVILANDSFVGPLVGVQHLLQHAQDRGADVYGITVSPQGVRHVQSYFTVLGPRALASRQVLRFWSELEPVDDRLQVIQRYELGFGRTVANAGLTLGSYFTATPHEERVMAARMASVARPPATKSLAAAAAYWLQPIRQATESPILGLWDRVFLDLRLPAVKVSLFTRNPYRIDRGAVLARLTELFPEAFGGFDAYLRRRGIAV